MQNNVGKNAPDFWKKNLSADLSLFGLMNNSVIKVRIIICSQKNH